MSQAEHWTLLQTSHACLSGETAVLWVPGEQVVIHRVARPAAPRQRWAAMLPWLLEEQLLDSPDTQQLCLLGETEEGGLLVAAVDTAVWTHWQEAIDQAGLSRLQLLPEYFALPWQGAPVVSFDGDKALWRTGPMEGLSLPRAVFEALPETASVTRVAWPVWAQAIPDVSVSLWQPASAVLGWRQRVRPWMLVTGLAVALPWIVLLSLFIDRQGAEAEALQWQEDNRAWSASHFSRSGRQALSVPEIEQRVLSAEQQKAAFQANPWPLLLSLDAILSTCDCRVRQLQSDGQRITLLLEGAAPARLLAQAQQQEETPEGLLLTFREVSP